MIKIPSLSIKSLFPFIKLLATIFTAEYDQFEVEENVRDHSFRLGLPSLLLWSRLTERQDNIERQHESFFLYFLTFYEVIIIWYPG